DLGGPPVGDWRRDARLQTRNGLFEHLLIEFETNLLDMAGLLLAEQIACAANVQVVGGKLEAGAKRIERLQDFKTSFGLRRNGFLCRQCEQCVGSQLGASHPPPQLIELRQPKAVGTM